jgi:hypothetical protein
LQKAEPDPADYECRDEWGIAQIWQIFLHIHTGTQLDKEREFFETKNPLDCKTFFYSKEFHLLYLRSKVFLPVALN